VLSRILDWTDRSTVENFPVLLTTTKAPDPPTKLDQSAPSVPLVSVSPPVTFTEVLNGVDDPTEY